ncbi:MAG: adenylate/guanylate cyclase domain-containing protein [Micrococcales bacterium]|nr:adenylate/guanylate cyclase domain-containing protein [Micrococcales bacterium]
MAQEDPRSAAPGEYSTAEDRASTIAGAPTLLTLGQVADQAGVSRERIAAFWAAMGMALPPEEAEYFTSADVDALIAATEVVDYGVLGRETETALLRAFSHTSERLAWWQIESLVADAAARFELDDLSARLVVLDRISDLADIFEPQMVYAWRRHLSSIIRFMGAGLALEAGEGGPGEAVDRSGGDLPLERAIGFADLVGYSTISHDLDAAALEALVGDFMVQGRDIVTRGGGRVVKEMGDGIMFATDEPVRAAQIALDLARDIGADGRTPPAHVGLAWGRVLGRFGDLFGPPVNLASRLADLAGPRQVVVDQATAVVLNDEVDLQLQPCEPVELAGVGLVKPFWLRHAAS